MAWLAIVIVALVMLLFVLSVRGRRSNYMPWINFGLDRAQPPDKAAMQALEDDVTELARDRPPKDLAP